MTGYPFDSTINHRFFFAATGMDPDAVSRLVRKGLAKADGGELYLQRVEGKALSWRDGRLQSNNTSLDQGFGFRAIVGGTVAYAHSNVMNEKSMAQAVRATQGLRDGHGGVREIVLPTAPISRIYTGENPLNSVDDEKKIALLGAIDEYTRAQDPRVVEVTANLRAEWDIVTILRRDGQRFDDLRPMSSLAVSVVVQDQGRRETGSASLSGRVLMDGFFDRDTWSAVVHEAIGKAQIALRSVPAPSGEMPVVVGNGWGGVLLHEAVGHGLEGDSARKGSSVFKPELLGQKIVSDCVTIVDQGNMPTARGALSFDDEGVATQRNVLIEDGVLKGYMQDTVNAHLMGVAPTGNGRRESYRNAPIPRMTTTYMEPGQHSPEDIIASVDRGLYAVGFSGGQVDTTSGDYVFAATEAYLIENGKITVPVRGAALDGNSLRSMQYVDMVGSDFKIAQSGSCGKQGQSLPVGIGQPTIAIRKGIKVGGTAPS